MFSFILQHVQVLPAPLSGTVGEQARQVGQLGLTRLVGTTTSNNKTAYLEVGVFARMCALEWLVSI